MSEIMEFLRARVNEDQQAAQAATPGPWRWVGDYPEGHCPHLDEWCDHGPHLESETATYTVDGRGPYPDRVITSTGYDASDLSIKDADADHITRHDPARVLREVEAMRRVISMYEEACHLTEHASNWDAVASARVSVATLQGVLTVMAGAYKDHEDFKEEWAL